MTDKLYRDKEWLEEHYIRKKLTCEQMAELAGCGHSTIWRWLKRYNIPRREQSEIMRVAWARGDFDSVHSEEYRRKISDIMKKRWQDEGYRRKMSEIREAISQDEEFRRKQSEATKAAWASGDFDSEEYRRKISEASQRMWQDEEFRSKMSRVREVIWQDEEYRRRISEARKATGQNEEYRRKLSEAMRAAWTRGDFSEERNRKISESKTRAWEEGVYDHVHGPGAEYRTEEWRREISEGNKAARARGAYDGVFQSPTSIEIQTAVALDILGIEHHSQFRPERSSYIFDEFVPPNILIEVHGDYWHGPERPEVQRRDAKKAQWAKDNDFHLVVIWEHEIAEQGSWSLINKRVLPLIGS